jgi:hypothetical protein
MPALAGPATHRRRMWKEAALLASAKSKVVQQMREERGALKEGTVAPLPRGAGGGALERPEQPLGASMLSGRLLRAQHARPVAGGGFRGAPLGAAPGDTGGAAGQLRAAARAMAGLASVRGGLKFRELAADGSTAAPHRSLYATDLFRSSAPAGRKTAPPLATTMAPPWALAAAQRE